MQQGAALLVGPLGLGAAAYSGKAGADESGLRQPPAASRGSENPEVQLGGETNTFALRRLCRRPSGKSPFICV